jgi:DNA-binding response OmpR family regulator
MPEAPDRSIGVAAPRAALPGAAEDLPQILVVEDDDAVGEELVDILGAYRMVAHRVADWPSAMAHLRSRRVDVVILDQWLGSLDSLTVLHEMRAGTTAHILMLTGGNSEADRIVGLEVGADDFLHKPISGREMVARVRAHLRRASAPRDAAGAPPPGQWRVDFALRQVFSADGLPVPLTSTEYELLALLMERPGQPVDRDTLSRAVLRRDYRCEDRALDNLVHNIRLKLGCRRGTGFIATVRNKGYAFTGFPTTR